MAEQLPSKRQREETQSSNEEPKRHKSYNHILSLLEAEEDEPSQDVSSLITSLQQHLSSDSVLDLPFSPSQPTTPPLKPDGHENPTTMVSIEDYTTATSSLKGDEDYPDEDKEQVIRHLLEASDDELGIPNREEGVVGFEFDEGFNNGGNGLALCDGLWELEDEAANYYTLLQSELFM
ncbi:hypothetical protein like AT1G69760 [Hibiscus trionum]|uniref:Uncharacterized protein n=1 Tax=Hibiscus trionum TaxID=183268 RepID=A0A9W7J124_HIBTR|nr:hypothetical protein like AT1G69760 [Hibiscus trionum]